jgi:hypothetical protein
MGKQDDEIVVLPPKYEKSTEVIQTLERIDSVNEIDEREPTDEELATLRRVSETIPIRAWYTLIEVHLTIGSLSLLNCVNGSPSTDVKDHGVIISRMPMATHRLQEC